jgi:hypothetical protein
VKEKNTTQVTYNDRSATRPRNRAVAETCRPPLLVRERLAPTTTTTTTMIPDRVSFRHIVQFFRGATRVHPVCAYHVVSIILTGPFGVQAAVVVSTTTFSCPIVLQEPPQSVLRGAASTPCCFRGNCNLTPRIRRAKPTILSSSTSKRLEVRCRQMDQNGPMIGTNGIAKCHGATVGATGAVDFHTVCH